VLDAGVQVLGRWIDNGRPAFASKSLDGWTSIYVGAAPLTVDVLRRIARDAGVTLWERPSDIVYATRDAVTVIATAAGERTLTFPHAMRPAEGGAVVNSQGHDGSLAMCECSLPRRRDLRAKANNAIYPVVFIALSCQASFRRRRESGGGGTPGSFATA